MRAAKDGGKLSLTRYSIHTIEELIRDVNMLGNIRLYDTSKFETKVKTLRAAAASGIVIQNTRKRVMEQAKYCGVFVLLFEGVGLSKHGEFVQRERAEFKLEDTIISAITRPINASDFRGFSKFVDMIRKPHRIEYTDGQRLRKMLRTLNLVSAHPLHLYGDVLEECCSFDLRQCLKIKEYACAVFCRHGSSSNLELDMVVSQHTTPSSIWTNPLLQIKHFLRITDVDEQEHNVVVGLLIELSSNVYMIRPGICGASCFASRLLKGVIKHRHMAMKLESLETRLMAEPRCDVNCIHELRRDATHGKKCRERESLYITGWLGKGKHMLFDTLMAEHRDSGRLQAD